MSEQQQKQRSSSRSEDAQETELAESTEQSEREPIDTDIDDILGEIDNVLENNAQEFVNAYIQKGGE